MLLNINDDRYRENPDESTVMAAVSTLQRDQFAVLARADQDFIQAYHNEDGTFDLEFRAGSYDMHFRAVSELLTIKDVANAFAAYMTGQPGWNDQWEWETVEFDPDFEGDLTRDTGYLINGEPYEKVPVGGESLPIDTRDGKCPACRVVSGQYHEPGCDLEECPCCHGRLQQCDCE